ncbi:hypothetical protein V8C42DRAFT_308096 [Trichoderma barbatum]
MATAAGVLMVVARLLLPFACTRGSPRAVLVYTGGRTGCTGAASLAVPPSAVTIVPQIRCRGGEMPTEGKMKTKMENEKQQ